MRCLFKEGCSWDSGAAFNREPGTVPSPKSPNKQERLAAALRENLKRRKAQAREKIPETAEAVGTPETVNKSGTSQS